MTQLALYVLSLALLLGPGKKFHALELRPDCGSEASAPTCSLERVCADKKSGLCDPPRWESCFWGWKETFKPKKDRATGKELPPRAPICHPWREQPGAWVQVESRDAAARRFALIAQAIADSAEAVGGDWAEGTQDFARAELVASYWSTGLREDIQRGRTRGPGGEVCLMDLKPETLRTNADPELAALPNEAMIAQAVGLGYPELRRCFDAGGRALLQARRGARWLCHDSAPRGILMGLFSVYHTGGSCDSFAVRAANGWKWCPECRRADTMMKFRGVKETRFPDWFHLQDGNW